AQTRKASFGLSVRKRISGSLRRFSRIPGRPLRTTPSSISIPMRKRSVRDPDQLVLGTRQVPHSYTDQEIPWGISHAARRNHVYICGKTGMGKTALLRNIILADIWRGAGVGVIDPHGDLAEDIIDHIPPERSGDVVYFNPSDLEYPIAWNLVDTIAPDDRPTTADFLVEACKDLFGESWGPRLQFILYHALRARLDANHTTLLDVYRLLTDDEHRAKIVSQTEDPVTRDFWFCEFAGWPARERLLAVGSIRKNLAPSGRTLLLSDVPEASPTASSHLQGCQHELCQGL